MTKKNAIDEIDEKFQIEMDNIIYSSPGKKRKSNKPEYIKRRKSPTSLKKKKLISKTPQHYNKAPTTINYLNSPFKKKK